MSSKACEVEDWGEWHIRTSGLIPCQASRLARCSADRRSVSSPAPFSDTDNMVTLPARDSKGDAAVNARAASAVAFQAIATFLPIALTGFPGASRRGRPDNIKTLRR